MTRAATLVPVVVLLLVSSGCGFRPDVPSGALACGARRECPDGYRCSAEGLCCAPEDLQPACRPSGSGADGGDGRSADGGDGRLSDVGGTDTSADGPAEASSPSDSSASPDSPADAVSVPDGPSAETSASDTAPDVPPITSSGCDPFAPGSCSTGNACFIQCRGDVPVGICYRAGPARHGEACDDNSTCTAGTGCYNYDCGPEVCLAHCRTDADCGGNVCREGAQCGQTGLRVCSESCDPRPPAVNGCAPGLFCDVFPPEAPGKRDHLQCSCPGSGQSGPEGAACTRDGDCLPGHLCTRDAVRVCRRVCKLAEPDCPAGKTCRAPAGYTTWGLCQP